MMRRIVGILRVLGHPAKEEMESGGLATCISRQSGNVESVEQSRRVGLVALIDRGTMKRVPIEPLARHSLRSLQCLDFVSSLIAFVFEEIALMMQEDLCARDIA